MVCLLKKKKTYIFLCNSHLLWFEEENAFIRVPVMALKHPKMFANFIRIIIFLCRRFKVDSKQRESRPRNSNVIESSSKTTSNSQIECTKTGETKCLCTYFCNVLKSEPNKICQFVHLGQLTHKKDRRSTSI